MGKEQDLLQAAKNGNVAQIEKILGLKTRKSGIQSLISRTVNPNHQDELGNTSLHHAALNGHRSSVELLLKYDASTNIPDNSGNYPLHLAAWNGHADVAKVLINTGPSRANVNEQNGTEEAALHSASQFGHSTVVAVLLENHADPYVRNSKQESPLDLAAQYGRMETVKQLLSYHPNLLEDVNVIKTHTPLHLAARNGHMNVVSYFLSCGMDVNIQCNRGTALHEAALFGKVDVVNLLLQCGIDATVVDSSNKTVMDLLSSHPSARSREIKDLIYASSIKEPVSDMNMPFSWLRERMRGSRIPPANKLQGNITRACSAIYSRNMTYSDVPEPRPYLKGVDPSNLRRSGSYDFVPSHRARQESLNQSNYDIVPPPRDRNAATEYAEESPWPSNNIQIPPAGKDYALLGPAESPFSSAAPVLSPHEITEGYTLLGSPAQGAASPLCPLRPDSAYAEVRSEGQNFLQPKQTPPSQGVFDDYSRLRFPSEDGEATAPAGMAGRDNPGYFMVSHPSHQHSQSVKQNSESYDFVAPIPRPSSYQPESTYEVPPLSLRGRGNGQEEDHPAIQGLTPQTFGGRSPEVYENTFIPPQKQKQEQRQQRSSEYDLVSLPSRKASQDTATYGNVPVPPQDSATYGNVPVPAQDLGTYDNVSVQRQVSATYDNVPAPGQFQNQMLEDVASTHDSSASAGYSSSRGSQACPLDVPDYEFVQLRKPSDGSAPEMQPFAALPGYEPMGPPDNQRGGDEYEFLAPFVEPQERPDARGDYETLAMVAPQRTGSQTGATAVPGSMNLPVSSPLYEVPPTLSSPVYEIAPPPRQTPPISSPVYEIAPPPRQTAPPPPPQEMPMQLHGDHEGHWIEVEHSKDQPKVPPRRQNQYSECPLVKRPEPETPASSKPPKPGSYEQVRLEGPDSGAIDWDKLRQLSRQESGGEYCTISAAAAGPGEAANRDSSSSSDRSSITDTPMTPPFSPPSPSTAVAMVFDTLGTFPQSDMSTIPEVSEDSSAGQESPAPVPKPRARKKGPTATKPKVLPRSDSLNDEEFHLSAEDVQRVERSVAAAVSEEQQDPFSFPPTVSSSEVELKKKTVKKSDFGDLHKRFSPYSSREDLTADSPEAESQPNKKREEPDGAEVEPAVKPSPLVYENVLFKRSENSQGSENGHVVKSEEQKERPESYRLSALSADSPMDESEEWKKIEAFLSTFSQIDVPQTLDDRIADAGRAETVPDWLKALDLGQFESSMMANGFDDIRFLNGVIEDEDLLDIGIEKFSHRRTIMEAVKSLPRCPRLSDPAITKPESVEDWLELIALPEYLGVFQHNGFTSLERVLMLWEVELTSVLEINSLGHRKRMLASVTEELKESDNKQQIEEPTDLEDSSAQLEDKLAELKMYCPDEKPPTTTTATPTSAEDLMAAAESMIASSTEAAEAKPRKKQKPPKRWKHDPSVLVKGSVNYSILYLGSHAVKTITGLESTIEACRKMRLSTAKLQKIPSVVLSVSVKGIKFIDGRSKIIVSHHEMSNISYITQDPNDRRVLAYIAKDSKTDRHYCHVFRADSNTASDEVTMTIGQAFELAFSHFVQTHNPSSDQ